MYRVCKYQCYGAGVVFNGQESTSLVVRWYLLVPVLNVQKSTSLVVRWCLLVLYVQKSMYKSCGKMVPTCS